MKKLSRNEIYKLSNNIIPLRACTLNILADYAQKIGFNQGYLGWNYDVFLIHSSDFTPVIISQGYRPLRMSKDRNKYEVLAQSYECEARALIQIGETNKEVFENLLVKLADDLLKTQRGETL